MFVCACARSRVYACVRVCVHCRNPCSARPPERARCQPQDFACPDGQSRGRRTAPLNSHSTTQTLHLPRTIPQLTSHRHALPLSNHSSLLHCNCIFPPTLQNIKWSSFDFSSFLQGQDKMVINDHVEGFLIVTALWCCNQNRN